MMKNSGKDTASGDSEDKGLFLGDFKFSTGRFDNLLDHFSQFQTDTFQQHNEWEKHARVNQALCALILEAKTPCFLLPAVIDYFEKLKELKILESYTFHHFELWLNQFSHLSFQDNYTVRAKIAGKLVPRDAYQTLFPIAMDKIYPGAHFVTGHGSPDLDTTVASFWGWLDAFAARVSEGVHLWNVPSGPPPCEVEMGFLFDQIFGSFAFPFLAKTRTTLSLSSLELLSQKSWIKTSLNDSLHSIDYTRAHSAMILVDEKGSYLGDWRHVEIEDVRSVILLLNSCFQWFSIYFQFEVVSLFAKKHVVVKDLQTFVSQIFLCQLGESQPIKAFTEKQRTYVQDFLVHILKMSQGLQGTFEDVAQEMKKQGFGEFYHFIQLVSGLEASLPFDSSGHLIENRSEIFRFLEKVIKGLESAIQSIQIYMDRFAVALGIKAYVFKEDLQHLTYRDDVDEMRTKMGDYSYLTVAFTDEQGNLWPLGVVNSHDLHRPVLGTVSLRDFCNREETKIPSYLEVISVIDHHKTSLHTLSAPVATIADAQSSNVLCAELSFAINDAYGLGGMTLSQIQSQLVKCTQQFEQLEKKTIMQRLLQRFIVAEQEGSFFVDPQREFIEYLHFLFGILDDTDLLTKVSCRDVMCVKELLNRMKSLMTGREMEIISFDDFPKDSSFVAKSAKRILQNPDMYSLYQKIYAEKEKIVEIHVLECADQKNTLLFADTKVQNKCARVGQTKLFSTNYPVFLRSVEKIRQTWYENLTAFWKEHPEIDLHLHMVSTIASAKDLYEGHDGQYEHLDEMWVWIPFTEESIQHLKQFLSAFKTSKPMTSDSVEVELYGEKAREYEKIFEESFLSIEPKIFKDSKLSIAVIKYAAGSLNSRKAHVSPYLPKPID